MKSLKLLLGFLSFSVFFTPTIAHAYRVTTVETHYVEPEVSSDVWLVVLLATTLLCLFSEKIAPNYVQTQEDIEEYRITVKVKRGHNKTVSETTFAGSEYEDVIEEALAFAQDEYEQGYFFFFKPSIKMYGHRHFQALEVLKLKNPCPSSWKRTSRDLTRLFLVPEKPQRVAPTPRPVYVCQPSHVVERVTVIQQEPSWYSFWIF